MEFVDFNESPHKNKKAYDIDLIYTQGTQNYDSQIGINIYPLPIGKFTIIMEYYYPENIGITVSRQATTAIIDKQISKNFSDYIKLLVQFDQRTKDTPDYLYFNIQGSGTTSTNPEGYLVFYGMTEWFDSVDPKIYDHALESSMFEYKNGYTQMNTDIDMNNKKIINLIDGTDANDAVNKGQLTVIDNKIDNLTLQLKNSRYKTIFGENIYDLTESDKYILKKISSSVVIDSILPNLNLKIKRRIQDYSPDNGLVLSPGSYIVTPVTIYTGPSWITPTSYTFFMTFLYSDKKTGTISFMDVISGRNYEYPQYIITPNEMILKFLNTRHKIAFSSDFINKRIFIWVCVDGTRDLFKMALSNFSTHISETYRPSSGYQTNRLEINYDVFIKKIGFINRFIDTTSLEFYQIMLEEKKMDHISNNITK